ncbi:hypothetical protein [Mammaliicoccus sp. Dog046]|uniref:hypothetical protein n=1 Tax=Mammaliicoccus sp. Dog046 TaxID=3034233 RepID=UPI002B25DE3E|nr:hypothetical protein [Mammaliicoccus sp. Dog046]WQK85412.1 hypothetical protein P3U32_12520 [Mammaliicoccus sp. Dog046]
MKIYPSQSIYEYWINNYFRDFDLFFVNEILFVDKTVSIISKNIFKTSEAFNININNLYEFWNLDEYHYVIQSPPGWLENQNNEVQTYILKEQRRTNNPLYKNDKLITLNAWQTLSREQKIQFFKERIDEYQDNITSQHNKATLPDYLQSVINEFPYHQGANCLSLVIFSLTRDKDMLNQWIKGESFLNTIMGLGYTESPGPSRKGDIIFFTHNDSIVHATYQIDTHLFINKNGQTIFNPYKLITHKELENSWGSFKKHIYRQT